MQAKWLFLHSNKLVFPQQDAPLKPTTDASSVGVEAVLKQLSHDSDWQPLGFYSSKLTEKRQQWSTFDRELLAVSVGIEKFHHLLEGRDFLLRTDHKPLTYIKAPRKTSKRTLDRRERLIEYILQFKPSMEHMAGQDNTVKDVLSRDLADIFVKPPTM